MNIKQKIFDNLKNIPGWRTDRKLVAFAVDDYGNVRLNSRAAYETVNKAHQVKGNRFDQYDTLETREDLEGLYEVLASARDGRDHHAVFTPYALPCNIDFEKMGESDYCDYHYELLPQTYEKLEAQQPGAYSGTWALWKEGIRKGLMQPQFHGREHFNLKVFEEKLACKDPVLMASLENRSLIGLGKTNYPSINWTAAFSFWDAERDTERFPEILRRGVDAFERVYGYRAVAFTPPAQQFPESMEKDLTVYGIQALDKPFFQRRHMGMGRYKKRLAYAGYKPENGLVHLVRNVVFEPTHGGFDHVAKAIQQIGAAFRWNRPALISSHRVNFCGHIDPKNRAKGLGDLKSLLDAVVKKWPEVEFVSVSELVKMMARR
ncbi:hypothetical protein ACFPFU_07770 [Negadavirga shengliensis]|uniref:Polysaccharide (De)acetylase n=1 Tax=Negadavirga shengliensis TaxID=1389218 RepID=A0ABV9SZV3_9BACT